MQLNEFLKVFHVSEDIGNVPMSAASKLKTDPEFAECIERLGGKSFSGGLYRVFRGDQIEEATRAMSRMFPEFDAQLIVFGCDWLGRHFALDRRLKHAQSTVLLLETGAGEAINIPSSIVAFHNQELVNYGDEALAARFYKQWKALHSENIPFDKCVGYKVPLFLGGADTIENLELIELSIYVELCGQLRNKTRFLPPGVSIRGISIK
jgi:hypothetical protein